MTETNTKTKNNLPTYQAIHRGRHILTRLECEGADFIGVDDTHAYMWHKEELVNLFDHQHLIRFLEKYSYIMKRTENKMIIAAWIIFEATKRCE